MVSLVGGGVAFVGVAGLVSKDLFVGIALVGDGVVFVGLAAYYTFMIEFVAPLLMSHVTRDALADVRLAFLTWLFAVSGAVAIVVGVIAIVLGGITIGTAAAVVGSASFGFGYAIRADSEVLRGATIIVIGLAVAGVGVNALVDGRQLLGMAAIGYGLASVAVGAASLIRAFQGVIRGWLATLTRDPDDLSSGMTE